MNRFLKARREADAIIAGRGNRILGERVANELRDRLLKALASHDYKAARTCVAELFQTAPPSGQPGIPVNIEAADPAITLALGYALGAADVAASAPPSMAMTALNRYRRELTKFARLIG